MHAFFRRFDLRVSMVYATIAALWIILSDSLMAAIFDGNVTGLAVFSIVKGLLFVTVTTLALFGVLHVELLKRDHVEQALKNDITERIKTYDALRRSEGRFTTIFHKSPVPISITRLNDAHLVDVNAAYADLFSYSLDELIEHTAVELGIWVYPEQRASVIETISKMGGVRGLELQGRTKSGAILQLLVWSEQIDLGDSPHIVSMLYDITEQRKMEEQLRYQAKLLAHVSDAVISTDLDFNIRSWNPAAELTYGWQATEVMGKSAIEILRTEYPDTTRKDVLEQFKRDGVWQGETIQRRKDGSSVDILTSSSYVTDAAGNPVGTVTVNRNITESKQAQQALQDAEIQRMQVEKERELLQLKERFLSVVSHEFRTPLSIIMTSAELIQRYYDRLTKERHLKNIHEVLTQAEYMTSLLEDVLTVNKARAGRLEFNPAPLDFVAFCQATLERIQVVDQGQHNFIFTHRGELADLSLDAKLLNHILVNLLSNAVKYSPDGGDVRLELERQNGDVVFQVRDHGIGIPPESLPSIYDPFNRASNTGKISGTGLGMAIVKESVDLHQGTIACVSEVGVGTTFTVRLPTSSDVNH